MGRREINYPVTSGAAAADVLPLESSVDRRRSAFFRTVLTLVSSFSIPFSFLSLGTGGPSCAGELMMSKGPSVVGMVLLTG